MKTKRINPKLHSIEEDDSFGGIFKEWGSYFSLGQSQIAHIVEGEIIDIDCEVIEEPSKPHSNV